MKKTNSSHVHHPPVTETGRRHRIAVWLLPCLLLFVMAEATAQLRYAPHPRKVPTKQTDPSARTRAVITKPLSLPFWDDFSFTVTDVPSDPLSNFPLDSLWFRGDNVYISGDLAINAPTLNVASFDGLNAEGLPYSDQVLANGFRDTLESQPINLLEVPPAERNTVYLSFFYQWAGNGEPPDPSDYMQVSFLDSANGTLFWKPVMKISPRASFDNTVFYDTIVQVTGDLYFRKNFRFRFENYGRRSGPFDTWNIDYVYLNKNRTLASSKSFPERAMASSVSPLFGKYNSIPLQHFNEKKEMNFVSFDVKNMKNNATDISISFRTEATFYNLVDGNSSRYHTILKSLTDVNGELGGLMDPLERIRTITNVIPDVDDPLQFDPNADTISIKLKMTVSGDLDDPDRLAFTPVNFTTNDTVSATYNLMDYYAYDDGTAEYSVTLTTTSDRLAYGFELQTEEPDTLTGFDIYFPDFGLTSNRLVDFYVYAEKDGLPDDAPPLYEILSRTVERKGNNTFQRIRIIDNVIVPKRFYIGYKSPSVRLGLDRSNNTGDRIYVNSTGEWLEAPINGSLMIRPVFGKKGQGNPTGIPPEEIFTTAYPNPSRGEFYLHRSIQVVQVANLAGQSVAFETELSGDEQKVTLPNATTGMYILKLKKGNALSAQKILIRK